MYKRQALDCLIIDVNRLTDPSTLCSGLQQDNVESYADDLCYNYLKTSYPVSYTHLDVYKRQDKVSPFKGFHLVVFHLRATDKLRVQLIACLLYTSFMLSLLYKIRSNVKEKYDKHRIVQRSVTFVCQGLLYFDRASEIEF